MVPGSPSSWRMALEVVRGAARLPDPTRPPSRPLMCTSELERPSGLLWGVEK